jgi:hypothetical protein
VRYLIHGTQFIGIDYRLEEFEDSKGVIISRRLNKHRQYHCLKIKNKRRKDQRIIYNALNRNLNIAQSKPH